MAAVICREEELENKEMVPGSVDNIPVFVCRTSEGEIRAFIDRCPHQGACMSKGKIDGAPMSTVPGEYSFEHEGDIVRCPWHGREYNLRESGKPLAPVKGKLKEFSAYVEDSYVYVELKRGS